MKSNVISVKNPLQEFEILHDDIDLVVVLTCWKLDAIIDKLNTECPPPVNHYWKFWQKLQHSENKSYNYVWLKAREK